MVYSVTVSSDSAHLGVCRMVGVNSHELTASVMLGRWTSIVDLFGRVRLLIWDVIRGASLVIVVVLWSSGVWGDCWQVAWVLPGTGEGI